MTKISIILASGGKNLELAKKIEEQLSAMGAEVTLINLLTLNLPLYTAEAETKHDPKGLLGPWFNVLNETDGFVFLSPEYNGGIPPILTNFIAWVSRSSKDWRACFNGKAGALGTFSGGGSGHVLNAMRMQLSYIGLNLIGRQILTNAATPLDEQAMLVVCKQLMAQASK